MTVAAQVAVLIDCDNVAHVSAASVLARCASYGRLSIKRAYGDWTSPHLSKWRNELHRNAIQPVQQFAYTSGKNATDSALIIDAMDLLHLSDVDIFCIVSSDSDFTRLAGRLRESGKRVYGFGEPKAPEAFRNSCDEFVLLPRLQEVGTEAVAKRPVVPRAEPPEPSPSVAPIDGHATSTNGPGTRSTAKRALRAMLTAAIEECAGSDGWAQLSAVGHYVNARDPKFDSRKYGHTKLNLLVRGVDGLEVKQTGRSGGPQQVWVRLASKNGAARKP